MSADKPKPPAGFVWWDSPEEESASVANPLLDALNAITLKYIFLPPVVNEHFTHPPVMHVSTSNGPSKWTDSFFPMSLDKSLFAPKPKPPLAVEALMVIAIEPLAVGDLVVFTGTEIDQDPVTGATRSVHTVRRASSTYEPGVPVDGVALSAVDAGHYTFVSIGAPFAAMVAAPDGTDDWFLNPLFVSLGSAKNLGVITGISD